MIDRLVRMRKIGFRIGKVTSRKTRSGLGAVDLRGLDELARHLGEPCVDRDRHERDRAPDDEQRHHGELRERRRVPVVLRVVTDVELREDVVEDAVLEVRHPEPDLHGDDGGHRPDEDEARREEHADPRRDPDEQERDERPDADRQSDVRRGEDHRPEKRAPEDLVVEDGRVVVEADPDALALDQLGKPVLLERERGELVQRVAEDRGDHDDHREDQQVRNRRLRDAA